MNELLRMNLCIYKNMLVILTSTYFYHIIVHFFFLICNNTSLILKIKTYNTFYDTYINFVMSYSYNKFMTTTIIV